jgi:hypothetical protein
MNNSPPFEAHITVTNSLGQTMQLRVSGAKNLKILAEVLRQMVIDLEGKLGDDLNEHDRY